MSKHERPAELLDMATEVLKRIELSLAERLRPDLRAVARSCEVPVAWVRESLYTVTGLDFVQCCRALRLRYSVTLVAFGTEQFAQIAYLSGYEFPSQFGRDFKAVFGVSPKQLRRLCVRRGLDTTC
jgi:AraC-like DNA-binding protein